MKITKLKVAIIASLLVPAGVVATQFNTREKTKPVVKQQSAKQQVAQEEEPKVEDAETLVEQPTVAPAAAPAVEQSLAQPTTPEPVDPYEYVASNYPHLIQNSLQRECFDAIIARFPERFTPENTKDSIDKISVFANACTTWTTRSMYKSLLDAPGGVFAN